MAIAIVGTPDLFEPTTNPTAVVNNVPAGVVDGNFLIWALSGAITTVPATPAGWTLWQSGTTTSLCQVIWYRTAASEPANYSATVATSRWTGAMVAFSGVDTGTPKDVTVPAATAGTTAVGFPAVTPVTAGAWVLGFGAGIVASGVTTSTAASSNMTLDATSTSKNASNTNAVRGIAHFAWSSGAFTPAMTISTTITRSLGINSALRPAAAAVTPQKTVRNDKARYRATNW